MYHAWRALGARAFSPPLGLLVVASYLPEAWEVRLVDESIRPVSSEDLAWADAVFITGMHIQRSYVHDINARAQAAGKITVLGGPSVSACPEWYADVDILHLGELGDATDAVVARIDRDLRRPARQERFTCGDRVPLSSFPIPAYDLVEFRYYLLGSVQSSSGCPFRCEFCDIPELYGRNPRLKPPGQVLAELDAMLAHGNPGVVFFVDDNLIGNRKAAAQLLPELVRWQEERGYPLAFACEATLDLAECGDLLGWMREARFQTIFCGIETPEIEALKGMHKEQNLRRPITESVQILNRHGLHVVGGIIFGLDTDTPETGDRVADFVEASQIPLFSMNILQALPRTPLWERLEAAGRLVDYAGRGSNVEFLLPEETVHGMWRECMRRVYSPDRLFDRIDHQFAHTFPNRKQGTPNRSRATPANLRRALRALAYVVWHLGVRAPYRRRFWRTAWPALRRGLLEELIESATIASGITAFTEEVLAGAVRPGLYDPRPESGGHRPPRAAGIVSAP